ncbi:hypothetical protein ACTJK5_09695 [Agrobacterium sp. 22094]|uniref:hypothetical protein n=1 Tax=Agrobacterium sp. 22094 TaxID=3453872 RepID=UPI003F84B424
MAQIVNFRAVDALLARSGHCYKTRKILGEDIPMRELTILEWLQIAQRFPQVARLFEGLMPTEDGPPVGNPTNLFAGLGPDPIAAIVAIAIGHPDPEAFERTFLTSSSETVNALGVEALDAAFGDGGFEDFFMRFLEFLQKHLPMTEGMLEGVSEEKAALQPASPRKKSGRKTASRSKAS